MKKIQLLFLIILTGLLSLGQLQRLTLGPVTALYIHDILISSWILLLVSTNFKTVLQEAWKYIVIFFSNWMLVLATLLGIIGWTAAIATDTFPLWTLLYSLRLGTYLFWAWLLFVLKPLSVNWLKTCFIASGLLVLLFGFLQYLLLPDVRFLSILGWDDHYYRLLSTQLDPNFTGLLLTITLFWFWSLPISFWQWLIHDLDKKDLQRVRKITLVFISGLLLVAISLTFSRSSILALISGSLIYGYYFSKKTFQAKQKTMQFRRIALAVVVVVVGTFVLAPKPSGEGVNLLRTSTAYARVASVARWLNTLEPYQLLIGRGLFVPPTTELQPPPGITADHANLPDNIIVLLISGLGVVGTSLLLLVSTIFAQKLNLRIGTKAIYISVAAHTMFNNSVLQPFILLFVLGLFVENSIENRLIEKVKVIAQKAKDETIR
jgi:hypothetical protein